MKNELILAFNEVLEDRQLPKEIIMQALEAAMVSAYRRELNASNNQHIEAKVDIETGKVTIFAEKEVVEEVQDDRTEVTLEEARKVESNAQLGDLVVVESALKDFGRVAAQTARQVIQQKIRDAERQAQLGYYDKQVGEIASGVVQAVNAQALTIGLEMKAEGTMPRKETIPGERFRIHERVRALVAEVKDSPRGPQIILSRTHRNFLRRLLENEVPEIYHGIVEIRSIAREPGQRAKVAVSATQQGIDPVGACVGIKGVRIQTIVRELHDEKIDVIEWNNDPAAFIAKAISPARVTGVYLNEDASGAKTATVVVPEDQLSLAIGRDGQNARLAAKLTNWRIDIKSLPEAAADTLLKLQNDPVYMKMAEAEAEVAPKIEEFLARRSEGRPLNPEDYDVIGKFVDRVEKRVFEQLKPVVPVIKDNIAENMRALVPEEVFEKNILDGPLTEHVAVILQGAGYATVGDLLVQMKRDSDQILRLQGIGPKAMADISHLVETILPVEKTGAELDAEQGGVPEALEAGIPAEELLEKPELPVTPDEVLALVKEEGGVAIPSESDTSVSAEEEEPSFDELFKLRSDVLVEPVVDEDEESAEAGKDKKGKKKKGKHVEVIYDPDADQTIALKKHKRGAGWEWEE